MSLCGANINFDAITNASTDLKNSLKSKLGAGFSSASDLTSLVGSKVTSLTSSVTGLLPEIPEVPSLSLQSELTALAGFDLKTPSGLLSYKSKLASITDKFGSSLSSAGFSLDDIVSKAAPALSGAGDLLSGATSALGSVTSGATSALGSVTSGATDALGAASGLLSGGLPSVPSFDICSDVPNFELPSGGSDAIQSAQDSVLAQTKGDTELIASFEPNVDFNAAYEENVAKNEKLISVVPLSAEGGAVVTTTGVDEDGFAYTETKLV